MRCIKDVMSLQFRSGRRFPLRGAWLLPSPATFARWPLRAAQGGRPRGGEPAPRSGRGGSRFGVPPGRIALDALGREARSGGGRHRAGVHGGGAPGGAWGGYPPDGGGGTGAAAPALPATTASPGGASGRRAGQRRPALGVPLAAHGALWRDAPRQGGRCAPGAGGGRRLGGSGGASPPPPLLSSLRIDPGPAFPAWGRPRYHANRFPRLSSSSAGTPSLFLLFITREYPSKTVGPSPFFIIHHPGTLFQKWGPAFFFYYSYLGNRFR